VVQRTSCLRDRAGTTSDRPLPWWPPTPRVARSCPASCAIVPAALRVPARRPRPKPVGRPAIA